MDCREDVRTTDVAVAADAVLKLCLTGSRESHYLAALRLSTS